MRIFPFPFRFGSVADSVTTAVAATPPLWGGVGATSQTWLESTAPYQVPRLERVYEQIPRFVDDQVNFAHRITNQFPFIMKAGNQVYLFSTITKQGPT